MGAMTKRGAPRDCHQRWRCSSVRCGILAPDGRAPKFERGQTEHSRLYRRTAHTHNKEFIPWGLARTSISALYAIGVRCCINSGRPDKANATLRRLLLQTAECDAADVAVLLLRVLFAHGLQAVGRRLVVQLTDVAHARLQVPLLVCRVLLEVGSPGRLAPGRKCEVNGGGADKRGQVLEHLVVLQRQLNQVAGEQLGRRARRGGDVGHLGEALEEDEGVGRRQLEVEPGEHRALHTQDIVARVQLIRDVHEVAALGCEDLILVLGGYEHGGEADELQLVAHDLLLLEEAVDQVDRQVQHLRHQLELEVHLHQPVDQDRAHLRVDVDLRLHVRPDSLHVLYVRHIKLVDLHVSALARPTAMIGTRTSSLPVRCEHLVSDVLVSSVFHLLRRLTAAPLPRLRVQGPAAV
eukprot:scaffold50644_cov69-Phaeocystis_antarctica.AAC.3